MNLVLDCSMTMAWLFEDEKTRNSEQLLTQLGDESIAIVPALWTWEVSNVLLVAQRRKRITRSQASGFMSMLRLLPIHLDELSCIFTHESTYDLALEQELSAYDSAYLELALRKQIPIATLDKKLRAAARDLGISVYS